MEKVNRVIYPQRRSFEKYDGNHLVVYLNEEIIPDYVPEEMDRQPMPEPTTAYAYQGTMKDGGTLIECSSTSRNDLVNGIIRCQYTQSEEDAIKTHRLQVIGNEIADEEELAKYNQEWTDFNSVRAVAKEYVGRWLS